MNVKQLRELLAYYKEDTELFFLNDGGRLESFSLDLEKHFMDEKNKLSVEGKEVLVTFSAMNK